jgi:preprotein translocase subunit SecF
MTNHNEQSSRASNGMNIAKNLKYFFVLPALLSLIAIVALVLWGLKPGIDLSGGSLLQVTYAAPAPSVAQMQTAAAPLNLGELRVQPSGTSGYIIRTRALTNDEKNGLEQALGTLGTLHEDQYTAIGPTIGAELLSKAWIAIALVVVCIIAFIAFAFRGKSSQIASWKYGIVAIVTLLHDVLVPTGLFAILGHFAGAEVDSLFIVALLTILGISINDTIVVFDRIRENLNRNHERGKKEDFAEVVGRSIWQTLARSINTSLTVVIVLVALYIWGPASTATFALTLIVGMIAGTYSSIFLASPLLVVWERWQR